MKILQEHFNLSWQIAVHNCKLILDGVVDSMQQKLFVSSLQNALELGCKQIMIDESDYRVVDYGPKKMRDNRIANSFLSSTDLNSFLSNLGAEELSKIFTIEFNEIVDIFSKKIHDEKNVEIKESLNILKKLRNNETHFYINLSNYLSFADFKKLCELLDFFFSYFCEKNILDRNGFGRMPADDEEQLIYFNKNDYSFVSYENLVKASHNNLMILNSLELYDQSNPIKGNVIEFKFSYELYGIAYSIFNGTWQTHREDFYMSFSEFYRRFKLMHDIGLIHIQQEFAGGDIYLDELGREHIDPQYELAVVTRTFPQASN